MGNLELSLFSRGQSTVQSQGMLAIAINVTLGTQTPYNAARLKKEKKKLIRSCQGFMCGLQESRAAAPLTSKMLGSEKRHNVY